MTAGKRIGEVLIFSFSEAVACHDDTAPEGAFVIVGGRELVALSGREQWADHGGTVVVEFGGDSPPIEARDAARGLLRFGGGGLGFHDGARISPGGSDLPCSRRSNWAFRSTPQR